MSFFAWVECGQSVPLSRPTRTYSHSLLAERFKQAGYSRILNAQKAQGKGQEVYGRSEHVSTVFVLTFRAQS